MSVIAKRFSGCGRVMSSPPRPWFPSPRTIIDGAGLRTPRWLHRDIDPQSPFAATQPNFHIHFATDRSIESGETLWDMAWSCRRVVRRTSSDCRHRSEQFPTMAQTDGRYESRLPRSNKLAENQKQSPALSTKSIWRTGSAKAIPPTEMADGLPTHKLLLC